VSGSKEWSNDASQLCTCSAGALITVSLLHRPQGASSVSFASTQFLYHLWYFFSSAIGSTALLSQRCSFILRYICHLNIQIYHSLGLPFCAIVLDLASTLSRRMASQLAYPLPRIAGVHSNGDKQRLLWYACRGSSSSHIHITSRGWSEE
jgi:hypothetical protein